MASSIGRFDFMFAFAEAKIRGDADPIAGAHAILGVTSSVQGDLMERARELARLLELWRAAPTRRRAQLRKELTALVPKLYPDICPEHQDIVHRAIREQCRHAKSPQQWKSELGCFYESVQKWLMKTGCSVCPLQERF